jgi:LL-diaminopimelate aminotransferase
MNTAIDFSRRLKKLPPYLFVEIERAKKQAISEGRDIIDLGVGDPDLPTPDFIIEALYRAAKDPANHRYALDAGIPELRRAIAKWYGRRFLVELDPDTEILPLIGSKEGIAHFPLAMVNPGECVLIPEPGYPPYRSGTIFAGAKPLVFPLWEENAFLPNLRKLKPPLLRKTRLLIINYPNNPTGAVASLDFYHQIYSFAKHYKIMVLHDAAYSELYYDGKQPSTFLQAEGAKDIGIEFHSFSKTFNMTGWRIGWACGNRKMIAALAKLKSNLDSGIFQAIQLAAIAALEHGDVFTQTLRQIYQKRRDVLVDGLNNLGWPVKKPQATFYLWAKIPRRFRSASEFAQVLLEKANLVVTPGNGFGKAGQGYVRMAITVDEKRLQAAVQRIKNAW